MNRPQLRYGKHDAADIEDESFSHSEFAAAARFEARNTLSSGEPLALSPAPNDRDARLSERLHTHGG